MWVRFRFDQEVEARGGQGWAPAFSPEQPSATEVPDHVVRRWDIVRELWMEVLIEVGEWKSRGMHESTRRLPTRLTPMELLEDEPRLPVSESASGA
jgi:hypothetical protein